MTRQKKLRSWAFIAYVAAQLLPTSLYAMQMYPSGEKAYRCGGELGWGFMLTGLSPIGACMAVGEFSDHGSFAGGHGSFFVDDAGQGFACIPGFAANLLFLVGLTLSFTRWRSWTRSVSICAAVCAVISATAFYWTGVWDLSQFPFLGTPAWIAAMFLLAAAAKGMKYDDSAAKRHQKLSAGIDAAELARVQEFADNPASQGEFFGARRAEI